MSSIDGAPPEQTYQICHLAPKCSIFSLKLAVVTPYHKESPETLWRCHQSVLSQTVSCTHILVSDGHPLPIIDQWEARHIRLPYEHGDYGDMAKSVGAMEAYVQGFDGIAFLDADNWYRPDHLKKATDRHRQSKSDVVVTYRYFCDPNETPLAQDLNTNGVEFADTNCMIFFGEGRKMACEWFKIPHWAHCICDRVLWSWVKKQNLKISPSKDCTVCYSLEYGGIYELLKIPAPPEALRKNNAEDIARALQRWKKETKDDLSFEVRLLKFKDHKVKSLLEEWKLR